MAPLLPASVALALFGALLGQSPPFRLKEVAREAESTSPLQAPAVPAAAGAPLEAGEVERLLHRLPALPVPPAAEEKPPIPGPGVPPPPPAAANAGDDAGAPVPPAQAGPLRVLRRIPEGEVSSVRSMSVTFSEPMVALGSADGTAPREAPVKLFPPVAGSWRWLGPRTLLFEPGKEGERRAFPLATSYRVEIPAGTQSLLGHQLEEKVEWNFATPPPRVVRFLPRGDRREAPLDPMLLLVFDQAVSPQAVLEAVHVRTGNGDHQVRLASREEVEKDESLEWWENAEDRWWSQGSRRLTPSILDQGTWVAFRPGEPLPAGTEVSVQVEPGRWE